MEVHILGVIGQRQRLRVLPVFAFDGELHLVSLSPLLSSCTDDRGGHFHLHLAAHDSAMLNGINAGTESCHHHNKLHALNAYSSALQ